MAMYDLTEMTGVRADKARTTMIGYTQIPATWIRPIMYGGLTGIFLTALTLVILGPMSLLFTIVCPPLAIFLMVDDVEAPWKKMALKTRSRNEQFLCSNVKLDMNPTSFVRLVPSCTPIVKR
ncbi:hypothetical protein [Actinomyces vulturis]|uniref:hypothetical protein n=1 Tax=Actinomyces vulturis TaxID=1857645 RepID=UPI00083319C4|nr:hypothetical protein [Actinomyces vulturis]